MFTTNIEQLRVQINLSAQQRIPFLFGVNFDKSEGFFIQDPEQQKGILFQIKGRGNKPSAVQPTTGSQFQALGIGLDNYRKQFDIAYQELQKGMVSVINLTIKTPLATNLSLLDIFTETTALYQLYIPNRLVCFSPEQYVRICDGKISTKPMKGTIDATITNAEQLLLNDAKEISEHTTVVKLVQQELEAIASDVRIERFRYIDRLKVKGREILQTSSEITGTLPSDYLTRLGDIIFDMLPASSILGAPDKEEAWNVIRKTEIDNRGFYTGIMGYFDGQTLDTGVLIRFIEQDDNKLYFRSGGGITTNSICEKEYDEIMNKIYLHTR